MNRQQGAFEVAANSVQGFLELLEAREAERVPDEDESTPRRAVFASVRVLARTDGTGLPVVTRTVRAAFAYGSDLVLYSKLVRKGIEFPHPDDELEKIVRRHEEAFDDLKRRLVEGIRDRKLSAPIIEATLSLPQTSGHRPMS